MADKQFKSLFDIIGPVMIGPSSSHTAGAVRIGNMARHIFKELPDSVNIYLFESFAETYKGHGTNLALLGGLLGMSPDDERIQDAMLLANEKGIDYKFIPLADKVEHPNTARFVMRKGNKKMSVTGVSIGGGNAQITQIDDYDLVIQNGVSTIVTYHKDVPGVIAKVSVLLNEYNINIASMKLWRKQRGKDASMVIEVDQVPDDFDVNLLLRCEHMKHIIYVQGDDHGFD
ncbi:serine dehydratase [Erysipelothrix larvae]|uniref:L-serine deaminase n=1 Tax=Erysipelothrix larvae TaxID=1514105 RepID=A0A109UGK6_9FIRM|nr:L-serine ammonia-lyase, iron-sulfur-dependent subunit beta [Erysipelothrix larvae]AMC92848.1 serine dehydratase [Erysipelothrix larvae]